MSCVGKTTFAQQLLQTHRYICFDELFQWRLIELFGLSIETNLSYISEQAVQYPSFVVDGWHYSDERLALIPKDATVYVVYTSYRKIIEQYRVPVPYFDQHLSMFMKWYDEPALEGVRYFENQGVKFIEKQRGDFLDVVSESKNL